MLTTAYVNLYVEIRYLIVKIRFNIGITLGIEYYVFF